MKLFRISNILLLCSAACLGGLLFRTSQSVQVAEDKLAGLNMSVRQEQESIRVLDAEWDYLNRPQRLEALAKKYLSVSSPESNQFVEDAAAIPEPVAPVIPPAKPAIFAQPVAVPAKPSPNPVPSQTIKASERQNFEDLVKRAGGGE